MTNILIVFSSLAVWQKTLLIAIAFTITAFSIRQKNKVNYPSNLPRVREHGRTRFSLKTRLAYYIDCESLFKEAYDTYSSKGLTCMVPGLGFRDEIILPTKSLRWMTAQPDDVLSVYSAFSELDQVRYSAGDEYFTTDSWVGNLVRTEMNGILENLCVPLNDELGVAFEQRLGKDKENWREINVWQTMRMVVAQASSRFTVGLPLCRNEEYLTTSCAYTDNFVIIAGIIGAMPKFLRPLIGSIAHIPQALNLRSTRKHFEPLLRSRLADSKTSEKSSPSEPLDHLQMMVRFGLAHRPSEIHDAKAMTGRLALQNFGAFHQTSMVVTNLIFNILGSDKDYNTLSILRDEIRSVLGTDGKKEWTKALIAKLVKCDSVCKETLRINSFGNRSPIRKVVADNLVSEDGIHLPKGSLVSILLMSQMDESCFPEPFKFNPWRYSQIREKGKDSESEKVGGANLVSLGERFLTFGYGKHSCPGRFLLEFELKMILAYLLLDYDFELLPEYNGVRPKNKWIAEAIMPPLDGKIRVKRRSV